MWQQNNYLGMRSVLLQFIATTPDFKYCNYLQWICIQNLYWHSILLSRLVWRRILDFIQRPIRWRKSDNIVRGSRFARIVGLRGRRAYAKMHQMTCILNFSFRLRPTKQGESSTLGSWADSVLKATIPVNGISEPAISKAAYLIKKRKLVNLLTRVVVRVKRR